MAVAPPVPNLVKAFGLMYYVTEMAVPLLAVCCGALIWSSPFWCCYQLGDLTGGSWRVKALLWPWTLLMLGAGAGAAAWVYTRGWGAGDVLGLEARTGCAARSAPLECLAWAAPPEVIFPHLRGRALGEDDLLIRRDWYVSVYLLAPIFVGLLVEAIVALAWAAAWFRMRASKASHAAGPYFSLQITEKAEPPQFWLSAVVGQHAFAATVSAWCVAESLSSRTQGAPWELYVLWQSVVLLCNFGLAVFLVGTKEIADLPSLGAQVALPVLPVLGEPFDVFKDWLFVGACLSFGGVAGGTLAAMAIVVLVLSGVALCNEIGSELLFEYFPVLMPKKGTSLLHEGLRGRIFAQLERQTSRAKLLIALSEDLPQAALQAVFAWLAGSRSRTAAIYFTAAKLAATAAFSIPVRAWGGLHGQAEKGKSGVWRQLLKLSAWWGDRHALALYAMGALGDSLTEIGEHGEAMEWRQRKHRILSEVHGARHPDTLTAMQKLAITLYFKGDLAGAADMMRQALDLQRDILGTRHPDTLTVMHNLAVTLHSQGDLAGAADMQREVLDLRREISGSHHPHTLTAMQKLATTLHSQGDLTGAAAMQREELDLTRDLLGTRHPHTLAAMHHLAVTLRSQGDLAGAAEMMRQALDLQREILGIRHPHTLAAMQNLAVTLRSQGDLAGAAEMMRQVLDLRREILGIRHPDTLQAMQNLAATLHPQGDQAGASEM